jgi:hypothetical protein
MALDRDSTFVWLGLLANDYGTDLVCSGPIPKKNVFLLTF